MLFANIPHQQEAQQRLRQLSTRQRMPHAQLLIGSENGDQLALALAMATHLLCLAPTPKDACSKCISCIQSQKHTHPDLLFTFPTGTKNTPSTTLAKWRHFLSTTPANNITTWAATLGSNTKNLQIGRSSTDALRTTLHKPPHTSNRKVVLLWLPEHLHTTAANTLLKTIEEPPPFVHVLLVTNDIHRVLSTLRSRAWHLYIPPTPTTTLKDPHHYLDKLQACLRKAYQGNLGALAQQAEHFHKLPPHQQQAWVHYSLNLIEHMLLHTLSNPTPPPPTTQEPHHFITNLSKVLTFSQTTAIITHLTTLQTTLQRHAHPRLAYLHTSLQLSKILTPKKNTT